MKWCLVFLCLAGVVAEPTFAAPCLQYGAKTSMLVGKLHRETFPGPPNFENIAAGDTPETGFYLTLKPPVCTSAAAGTDDTAFDSVTEVQLVLTEKQYAELRPKLGKEVRLQGQLFSAFTGHHHAKVLLEVRD
jgi:hypothetical protein